MKKVRSFPEWTVPLGAIVLVGVLAFLGLTRSLELVVFDLYTHLVPPPPERPEIVLLDADDGAIQEVGQWPWGRNLHAAYVAELRSLGAQSLSFDIEFVDRGPVGVSSRERDVALAKKSSELSDVFQALKGRQIKVDEAADYAKTILQEGILLTARDNDTYLGQVLKVFGNAFTTLNYDLTNDSADAKDASAYLKEHSAIGPVTGRLDLIQEVPDLRGAIVPIASRAAGAAVTNVVQDVDGTLRRMGLLFRIKGSGQVYGQMALVPLWVMLGRPAIEVGVGRITLKTSALAKNARPDVVIPLDPSGKMFINWPHKTYGVSFRHVGVSELQALQRTWETLVAQVGAMQDAGYFDTDLKGMVDQINDDRATALDGGDQAAFDQAENDAAAWRQKVTALASGSREADLKASLEAQSRDPKVPQASKEKIPGLIDEVGTTFSKLREKARAYEDLRASLEAKLKGAMVFYGFTAVATTDIGINPFDPHYYNVGTHASVANTILTGAHLNEFPLWISFLIGALLSAVVWLALGRMGTLPGVLVGFGVFGALVIAVGVFYAATGVYPGALVPGLTVFLTVLGLTLVKFWGTEAERRYIRGAFSTYLSPDVIKQLEADPSRLRLGGEKKLLTAMFTDVKGFSTISEKMDPNDLVSLLNLYLTRMCDLILDARGTIDKFEGDAIIAFWGAPLAFDDHALGAARSALRMKQAEAQMNEQLVRDRLAPSPLLTRIGINTGDMTVGNMGTARRMNYTMMGNAVNLAARLEGVNKEYGTWILTTEATRAQLDDSIIVRKLDRVRVVGIRTPVRLFEVASFRDQTDGRELEKIALFEEGIDAYEIRDWKRAAECFRAVQAIDPNDGPAKTFLERTGSNQAANLGPDWDGVFTLTSK
jgi:adenylate cyclase